MGSGRDQGQETLLGDGLVETRMVVRKDWGLRCVALLLCAQVDRNQFQSFSLPVYGGLS